MIVVVVMMKLFVVGVDVFVDGVWCCEIKWCVGDWCDFVCGN